MADYRRPKDNEMLAEMYSTLLLETPATNANIEKFIKKYYKLTPDSPPDRSNGHTYENRVSPAMYMLNGWTPRVQQVIKAAGGNPDIFGYDTLENLHSAFNNAQFSKTDKKKSYKKATGMPLVCETDDFLVYQPETWEASRKYFGYPERVSLLDGQLKDGSRWCTAASTPDHFHEYVDNNQDRLLYFIRKSDDALFAYRGQWNNRAHMHNRFTNTFIWSLQDKWVYDYIKMWQMLPENHPNKKWFHTQIWSEIQSTLRNVASYILEIRLQDNTKFTNSDLTSFYFSLHDYKFNDFVPRAEDFLKFVAFVVFGQTELTGFKQRSSDAELERDAHPGVSKEDDDDNFLYTRDENYRPSREELQIEAYKLLLETPATNANIERFMKVFLSREIATNMSVLKDTYDRRMWDAAQRAKRGLPPLGEVIPYNEEEDLKKIKQLYEPIAKTHLELWTPRVQQVIRARGGNPDIFSYSSFDDMKQARESASISETDLKKAYKNADVSNMKVIWETDAYVAYNPTTWEASKKYFGFPKRESLLDGQQKEGSKWCTAADDKGKKFKEYVEDQNTVLYYFIRKKDDTLYAARSRNLSSYTSDQIEERIKNAEKTLDAYVSYEPRTTVDTQKAQTTSQMTEDIYHFVSSMEYAGSLAWPLIECRTQTNGEIKLDRLFFELIYGSTIYTIKPKEYIEEFKKFMRKVVFGSRQDK